MKLAFTFSREDKCEYGFYYITLNCTNGLMFNLLLDCTSSSDVSVLLDYNSQLLMVKLKRIPLI